MSERVSGAHGVGVERQIVLLRQMEHADQVDRVALEHLVVGDGDAVVVDDEVVALGKRGGGSRGRSRAIMRLSTGARLGLAVLQCRRTGWR